MCASCALEECLTTFCSARVIGIGKSEASQSISHAFHCVQTDGRGHEEGVHGLASIVGCH